MGELFAVLAGLFFGLSNITVRQAQLQQKTGPFAGLFVGVVINNGLNLLLLAGFVAAGVPLPPLNFQALLYFSGAGLLTSYLGRELLFKSIRIIGPSRAGALKLSAPVFTVLLGVVVLGERISIPALMGIAIILIAVYFISRELLSQDRTPGEEQVEEAAVGGSSFSRGLFRAVLAGMVLGIGNVLRKLGIIHYASPLIAVSISSFAALIYMLFVLFRQGRLAGLLEGFPAMLRGGYLWTGLLTSLALYATFIALLYAPVSIVNSIKAVEPVFTMAAGYFLLRSVEKINIYFIALALIVALGVAVVALFP